MSIRGAVLVAGVFLVFTFGTSASGAPAATDQVPKLIDQARQALHDGQFQRASYLAVISDDTAANYWLAVAQSHLEMWNDALKNVNVFLDDYPGYADSYLVRAGIYAGMGMNARAIEDATASLRHYRIDNNDQGVARAQALLKTLGAH